MQRMRTFAKDSIVIFLALVVAGAAMFCLSAQTMAMPHDAGNMATHAGALTSATINTMTLVVAVMTFFVAVLASIRNEQKSGVAKIYGYEDFVSVIKKRVFSWLAIFERSPNAVQMA